VRLRFDLCAYPALEREPLLASAYGHVVLLDPPAAEYELALATAAAGLTHLAWGEPELRFAVHIHGREYQLRDPLAACYRALRDRGVAGGAQLEEVLRGDSQRARSAELAGRVLRVLSELELIAVEPESRTVRVISSASTSLERSSAYITYTQRLRDGLTYLEPSKERAA
jgi:single-stranded-DNA-specific exonuclease